MISECEAEVENAKRKYNYLLVPRRPGCIICAFDELLEGKPPAVFLSGIIVMLLDEFYSSVVRNIGIVVVAVDAMEGSKSSQISLELLVRKLPFGSYEIELIFIARIDTS